MEAEAAGPLDALARVQLVAWFVATVAVTVVVILAIGARFGAAVGAGLLVMALLTGLALGAAIVAAKLSEWRKRGGLPVLRETERAVRARRLPDDADPRVWVPRLERLDEGTTTTLLISLLWVGIGVVNLVNDAPTGAPAAWYALFAFAAFYGLPRFVIARLRRRTVKRLLLDLARRWQEQLEPRLSGRP